MNSRKKIKCGEYLFKDGVVIKRPGKKFRLPSLPEDLKIPYPDSGVEGVCFPFFPAFGGDDYDDIDQMNDIKEKRFQEQFKKLHTQLRNMYYIGQIISGIKAVCRRIIRRKMPTETVMGLMAQRNERQRIV